MMSLIGVFVVAAVVLLAVLVGAVVPAVLQLRSTLKSVQTFLDETRPKVGAVLEQASEAAGRVNRAAVALEDGMGKVRGVVDAVGALGNTLENARESLRKVAAVLGAIGPALAAGVRVFFPAGGGEPPAPETSESTGEAKSSGPGLSSEEAR